jgi:flagellar hook protein FlgE
MSLLGSLNAAVGGLAAQSSALGNNSDNVANSQTTGFKKTDTAFINYLTESDSDVHSPGAVVARPQYRNSEQGAVTQSSNPTALAVSGNGLFAVQRPNGPISFSPQQFYTRVGDFAPNSSGHLVNSTGYALDGWPAVGTSGNAFNTNALQPITISKAPSVPVPTSNVTLAANLPSTPPTPATAYTSTVQIRDAGGNAQNLTLNWSQTGTANQWDLNITSNSPSATTGPMLVTFGNTAADAGTITSIGPAAGTIPTTVPAGFPPPAGSPATIGLTLNFGLGPQAINLNLGSFGRTDGVTQFSGGDYQVTSQSQDGASQGNYTSVTIQPTGNVVINYDNGHSATVAKVPLVSFNDPEALQQQDGQAFTATIDSGSANVAAATTGGTGKLIVGATEGSNVDIASEFTKMIVAQRAYTANTKVLTTANQMLQDTLSMVPG